MARASARVNAAGEALSPATFEIASVKIFTNWDMEFEIRSIVSEITVNESLFASSIETDIVIADGINFFEKARLTGNERLEVTINRLEPGNVKKKFEFTCFIANIQDFAKPRPGVQSYRFSCVSEHAYINAGKRLNRVFQGGIGNIINNICQRDLQVKPAQLNKDVKGIIRGIYPNIKPLEAITWLLRNSTDNSTPFFFYETLKDGIIFDSYENLLEVGSYRKYKHSPFFEELPNTEENFIDAQQRIIRISSEFDMGKYFQIYDGTYGSTVNSVDIATKKYTVRKYSYDQDKVLKLNDHGPISTRTKFADESLSDMSSSMVYNVSLNSKAYNKIGNYHAPIVDSLSKKQSYHANLGYMGHDITIYGDFDMSVGKVIELEIYKASDEKELEEDRKNMIDKMNSGYYIVTELAHIFANGEYTIEMGIQKDSSMLDMNG